MRASRLRYWESWQTGPASRAGYSVQLSPRRHGRLFWLAFGAPLAELWIAAEIFLISPGLIEVAVRLWQLARHGRRFRIEMFRITRYLWVLTTASSVDGRRSWG